MCHVGASCVVRQTSLGSKTDRPSHRASPVKLTVCEEARLCLVLYITEYIRRTECLRLGSQLLILSYLAAHVQACEAGHGAALDYESTPGCRRDRTSRVNTTNHHQLCSTS